MVIAVLRQRGARERLPDCLPEYSGGNAASRDDVESVEISDVYKNKART
jgi:hypothetical protein